MSEQIYGLMGQAMREIGAIGKDSKNQQQGFMYRGIDAVYNALNPVMAKYGLFICPEVLEQTREERQGRNGGTLLYSILKIKYTMYAPDGSNVSCVVVGEGMDSGDKASNKAMSAAMKYAAFQLFMIPTEEMVDPDAEVHEVAPKRAAKPAAKPEAKPANQGATVEVGKTVPADPMPPVLAYLANERETLRKVRGMTKAENNALWNLQVKALQDAGLAPKKAFAEFTQEEATAMVQAMYANFTPTGTVLKGDGKTA